MVSELWCYFLLYHHLKDDTIICTIVMTKDVYRATLLRDYNTNYLLQSHTLYNKLWLPMMTYPHRPVLKLQNRFLNLPRKGHGDLPTSLLRNECTTNLGNNSLIICVMGWMDCLFVFFEKVAMRVRYYFCSTLHIYLYLWRSIIFLFLSPSQ